MNGKKYDIWDVCRVYQEIFDIFVSLISESLFECFQKSFTSANLNLIDFGGKIGACISGKTNGNEMTMIVMLSVKSIK